MSLSNHAKVLWTSNTKRERVVQIVTHLNCEPSRYIVKILEGLPGEVNTFKVVPETRLVR